MLLAGSEKISQPHLAVATAAGVVKFRNASSLDFLPLVSRREVLRSGTLDLPNAKCLSGVAVVR